MLNNSPFANIVLKPIRYGVKGTPANFLLWWHVKQLDFSKDRFMKTVACAEKLFQPVAGKTSPSKVWQGIMLLEHQRIPKSPIPPVSENYLHYERAYAKICVKTGKPIRVGGATGNSVSYTIPMSELVTMFLAHAYCDFAQSLYVYVPLKKWEKRKSEIRGHFEKAVLLNPNDPTVLSRYAGFLTYIGDAGSAQAILKAEEVEKTRLKFHGI